MPRFRHSFFYFLLLCSLTITLTSDIKIATNNAAPNEEKLKCSAPTKKEVILRIAALITNVNNPNVTNVKGRDRIVKIGLTNMFNTDNTKLARTAVQILLTWTIAGKRTANDMNVNVLTKIR